MFDVDGIREIWKTISRNKTRSILTAFGVFWGIFILVVLAASGNGFEKGLMSNIEGFATNTTFIFSDKTSLPYKGYRKGREWFMKISDVKALKDAVPEIKNISPVASKYYSDNNVFYGSKSGSYSLKGVLPEYNEIDRAKILKGRFVNETDIVEGRKVCVIGKRIYEELIGVDNDPLGLLIKVGGVYYHVVGVVQSYSKGVNINGSADETVVLPYTTMQRVYNIGDNINFMMISSRNDVPVSSIENRIKDIIKERHDISPDDLTAIPSFNIEEEFKMFDMLFLGIRILIWIVGLGTLLSGVVGVSNIMLVTVKERTREIGVRRALGAKPRLIITQVMSESLLLTTLAGLVGLCVGVAVMAGVSTIIDMTSSEVVMFREPQIGFWAAVGATAVVVVSGMLAGVLPALRAIEIKAIDAIREE